MRGGPGSLSYSGGTGVGSAERGGPSSLSDVDKVRLIIVVAIRVCVLCSWLIVRTRISLTFPVISLNSTIFLIIKPQLGIH